MRQLNESRRYLGYTVPLGALAGGSACAYALSRNLAKIYRGSLAYSSLSQALRFAGEERYGESWTFLVKDGERDLHVMITLAVCNPADTSYLSETTAAYLSFACWHQGSGWQLLDRYPLHQFHASGEHGEVRLGPFHDPRCFLKETTRDGLTLVEATGDLERETFLSNRYPGPLKDISWNFRFRFCGSWYPDAALDQLRGIGRYLKPSGVSLACRAAEIRGELKINDSFFEFNPEQPGPRRAFLLHRWGSQQAGRGPSITCLAGGREDGNEPSAFLACRFPGSARPSRESKADPLSLLFSLHDQSGAAVLRNHPLRHGLLRAGWGEAGRGRGEGGRAHLPRLTARGRSGRLDHRLEIIPDESNSLELVFPSPGGECIRQLWSPTSRLVLLRQEGRSSGRSSTPPPGNLDLPADFILEEAAGDWWDQVADMIEIPVDLSTF